MNAWITTKKEEEKRSFIFAIVPPLIFIYLHKGTLCMVYIPR